MVRLVKELKEEVDVVELELELELVLIVALVSCDVELVLLCTASVELAKLDVVEDEVKIGAALTEASITSPSNMYRCHSETIISSNALLVVVLAITRDGGEGAASDALLATMLGRESSEGEIARDESTMRHHFRSE